MLSRLRKKGGMHYVKNLVEVVNLVGLFAEQLKTSKKCKWIFISTVKDDNCVKCLFVCVCVYTCDMCSCL